jgi:Tol biopolymer transport system component
LPDGNHFLYLRESSVAENSGIYVGSLDAKPEHQGVKRLVATTFSPVFAPSADPSVGYLLFRRGDALLAQPLDLAKLEIVGAPVGIANHLGSAFEFGNAGTSTNGVLAYRSGNATGANSAQPTWFDRLGKNVGPAMAPGYYYALGLSPDAARVAVTRLELGNNGVFLNGRDIWLHEFARNTLTRFTFDKAAHDAVWSADGTHLAYVSTRTSGTGLYQKASNGAGGEETLLQPGGSRDLDDWSRDGRFLLYSQIDAKTQSDLWVLPLAGDRKPTAYVNSEFNETQGQFSPDGHWIAYVSDESGHPEIYVRPFPLASGGGSKWTVSSGGGIAPRWRRDGRELFYLAANGRTVMAADVSYTPQFKTGAPESLFDLVTLNVASTSGSNGFNWAVTSDGKRFLVITAAVQQEPSPITVVLNWAALMKN